MAEPTFNGSFEMIETKATGEAAVYISLGAGLDLGVSQAGYIILRSPSIKKGTAVITNLGPATTKRFIDLQNYLGRLIIHAVDA